MVSISALALSVLLVALLTSANAQPSASYALPAGGILCQNITDNKLTQQRSCFTVVKAGESVNPTGLIVTAGEEYTITFPDGQKWYDASRKSTPPCGENGSWVMNLFSWLKRSPTAKWFSVIAEVEGDGAQHDLCEGPYLRLSENGKLVLFANDAAGFYFNNSGSILAQYIEGSSSGKS